jgi:hypothetical protein
MRARISALGMTALGTKRTVMGRRYQVNSKVVYPPSGANYFATP